MDQSAFLLLAQQTVNKDKARAAMWVSGINAALPFVDDGLGYEYKASGPVVAAMAAFLGNTWLDTFAEYAASLTPNQAVDKDVA